MPIGSDVYAYNLEERAWRKLQVRGELTDQALCCNCCWTHPCFAVLLTLPPQLPACQVHGTPPPLRNAHAAAAVGTDLYVFGGRCGIEIGEASLNDLYRLGSRRPAARLLGIHS